MVGDKFRIGDIEFLVVNEDEIDDTAEDEAVVEDIEIYNKLDNGKDIITNTKSNQLIRIK